VLDGQRGVPVRPPALAEIDVDPWDTHPWSEFSMRDTLATLLLVLLILFAIGSGLCAVIGLTQLTSGRGLPFVVIGGGLAVASSLAIRALQRRFLDRPPGGPDQGPA
jgi:hypothetical protein